MPSRDRMGIMANGGNSERQRKSRRTDCGQWKQQADSRQQFKYTGVRLSGMKWSGKTVRGIVGTVRTKKAVR